VARPSWPCWHSTGRLTAGLEARVARQEAGGASQIEAAGAKHPALTAENGISSWAGFFASLRCAQNDKLLYVLVNKRITTIDAIESVDLSILVYLGH